MSHERTVERFVKDVEYITGVKIRIRWMPFHGLFLEDTETGSTYPLGQSSKKGILSPGEQESICRGLHREHWTILLGLDPPQDES